MTERKNTEIDKMWANKNKGQTHNNIILYRGVLKMIEQKRSWMTC